MRKLHKGWGAQTLYNELCSDSSLSGLVLPKPSTIQRFLHQKGLTKRYEKNRQMPVSSFYQPTKCHEIWQMDGQGNSDIAGVGTIAWLNIKDIYSHLYVGSFPAQLKSMRHHPNTSDYQCALRLGFAHRGLPEKVQVDHASVFYDNRSKSPFPTLLRLWLIALGIELIYSRVHQPTDQGQVERSHRTIEAQVATSQAFKNWKQLFDFAQQRLKKLNEALPCASLEKRPPLVAFPKAKHSGRFYQPTCEEQLLDLGRVYAFLQKGEWFRQVSKDKTISIGNHVYYLNQAKAKQQLQIKFDAEKRQFIFHNDKEQVIQNKAIKGIDNATLMGNHFQLFKMTNSQLEFPFEWETQKVSTTFIKSHSMT